MQVAIVASDTADIAGERRGRGLMQLINKSSPSPKDPGAEVHTAADAEKELRGPCSACTVGRRLSRARPAAQAQAVSNSPCAPITTSPIPPGGQVFARPGVAPVQYAISPNGTLSLICVCCCSSVHTFPDASNERLFFALRPRNVSIDCTLELLQTRRSPACGEPLHNIPINPKQHSKPWDV